MMDYQPVFRSLADPTRRAILCMLKEQDLCIGDIADHFQMTRPAVAKHLKILNEADLVIIETQGRERINRLNLTQLMSAMDWFNYFDQFWDKQLNHLKQVVEDKVLEDKEQ
ncbi:metalloregulator ArsR/SmtB family transcription factor [Paraglaciecola aquimarina]|uniref:Metalloregulator ArsR/SmtB family transcription factor n=1 Tax=Paraglaciecola algarum TaxID=3050085 RepID=A0ABS9D8V7_9ALTE|nr:metalloregulator ArsR/SmtB family transcription factor [Paraglaciecola sp. G1-23]MCF2949159.1 metalloregulator ArsR/SmtB family transcription factor [Paraglaciecola sp. G1-23]